MQEIEESRIDEMRRLHGDILNSLKMSLEKGIRIGELLAEQKDALKHGEFTKWVNDNLPFTDRTARNYMRLFNEQDRLKTESVSVLTEAYQTLIEHKVELQVDPEFHDLLPPLTEEEFRDLEEDILKSGCMNALVAWNGILLDGHYRYEICKKHGIEFKVLEMEFNDRNEATIWIIKNQLGRKNLTPEEKRNLKGFLYNKMKGKEN